MHFLLFSNVNKDPKETVTKRLEQLILSKGHEVTILREGDEAPGEVIADEIMESVDALIVLGGDGTMLRASHAIGSCAVPMIGLNLGTTGFLTEVECGAMEDMVDRLIRAKLLDGQLDDAPLTLAELNTVRERDEGFEKRAAELLNDMRQESRDMAALIDSLSQKVQNISDKPDNADEQATLSEIRDLMNQLNDQVKTVSDTLTSLSEEV